MAAVPDTHDFVDGIALSSEMNSYVRDPIRFALGGNGSGFRPIAQLRQTTLQSIPSGGSGTPITFDAEDYDNAGGHDNVTNNSRYTAQYAGVYELGGGVGFSANATARRGCFWAINGTRPNGSAIILPATAANEIVLPARRFIIPLAVGDYVELWAFQESGGALNTQNSNVLQSTMVVTWLSN